MKPEHLRLFTPLGRWLIEIAEEVEAEEIENGKSDAEKVSG